MNVGLIFNQNLFVFEDYLFTIVLKVTAIGHLFNYVWLKQPTAIYNYSSLEMDTFGAGTLSVVQPTLRGIMVFVHSKLDYKYMYVEICLFKKMQ